MAKVTTTFAVAPLPANRYLRSWALWAHQFKEATGIWEGDCPAVYWQTIRQRTGLVGPGVSILNRSTISESAIEALLRAGCCRVLVPLAAEETLSPSQETALIRWQRQSAFFLMTPTPGLRGRQLGRPIGTGVIAVNQIENELDAVLNRS